MCFSKKVLARPLHFSHCSGCLMSQIVSEKHKISPEGICCKLSYFLKMHYRIADIYPRIVITLEDVDMQSQILFYNTLVNGLAHRETSINFILQKWYYSIFSTKVLCRISYICTYTDNICCCRGLFQVCQQKVCTLYAFMGEHDNK